MNVLLTAVLAIALHLLLGWMWVVAAAVVGGFVAARRGWLVGPAGVAIAWLSMIVYTYAIAPQETSRVLDSFGAILGDVPGLLVVVATLVLAMLLGLAGGLIGMQAARIAGLSRI